MKILVTIQTYKEMILFIRLKEDIDWSKYDISFSHIVKNKKWNESSTISVNNVTISEVLNT